MDQPEYPEGTIISVAKVTLNNARETAPDLAKFGVTEERLNQLNQIIQTAEALPREKEKKDELKETTKQKNSVLDDCHNWGKDLKIRLVSQFGVSSAEVKEFPAKDFEAGIKSEIAMLAVMPRLINLAKKYQTKLAQWGQTDDVITLGDKLLKGLSSADEVQEITKDKKLSATQARYQLFNDLYDMVNNINRIGRQVFADDKVKRVLFDSKWPKPPKKDDNSGPGEAK